ncbi:hypothetical protein [Actinomadura macrotermitis]|uniref:Uncharacterized protein n=1 Tax=Actinomadura macrotermitis TaxID=2585200 RepID=A0A7K0BTX2_9ACTN|nr:hypothetical protein [Actinomadura macrotermitis]MQY04144.1 hypothetical protein [Actinomadura macrotermitis]
MPSTERSPRELREALRRIENRTQFFRTRQAAAATPQARAAVAWDQWRALIRDAPEGLAVRLADELTATINGQLRELAREADQ